jgi:excinuclease ABC subunit C
MTFNEMILNAPANPGVYEMFDGAGRLLYVGKAKSLTNRLRQYRDITRLEYNKIIMRRQVVRVSWHVTESEQAALVLEQHLIKTRRPKYNIILKDDKMYPFIGFSKGEFPRLFKFRDKEGRAGRNSFGPFPFVKDLAEAVKLLQQICRLRTCTDGVFSSRKRPCLLAQIGRCSAPCVNADADYGNRVKMAKNILRGHVRSVISDMTKIMTGASSRMDFEGAAKIKNSIDALRHTVG